ncbi:MAG: MFS transporter [Hyphomicrobiaceae bacterium]
MVWSVFTFTVATLMCRLASSLQTLVCGGSCRRGVAALVPLGQTILLKHLPSWQHGLAISVFGVANMAGPVIGPSLGGYIAEIWSWRWVFYLTVPFGMLAFVAFRMTLPKDEDAQRPALDWTGFLTLATALALARIVLSRGQRLDWFQSTEIRGHRIGGTINMFSWPTASRPKAVSVAGDLDRQGLSSGLRTEEWRRVRHAQLHADGAVAAIAADARRLSRQPHRFVISWRGLGAIVGFFSSNTLAKIDPGSAWLAVSRYTPSGFLLS